MPTKWASDFEIEQALLRWPRSVPDDVHVRAIMKETGLSEDTARLALDIARGDSIGDVVEVKDSSETS